MKDIDEFNLRYLPPTGGIAWPDSDDERVALARTIMGMGFVEAHDKWVAEAREIMNPKGKALARAFAQEASVRDALKELTEAERTAVDELIRIAVHGALFSALVSLDQYPRADLSINVKDEDGGIGSLEIAPQDEDLHEAFYDWLKLYSSEWHDA